METAAAGRWRCRDLVLGCGLVWLIAALGCAAPDQPRLPAATPARLVVANVSGYTWRLTLSPSDGGAARIETLPPRAERTVEVAGGTYAIEQAVTGPDSAPGLARRLACRFEPGQTYRWQLATLLSETPLPPR